MMDLLQLLDNYKNGRRVRERRYSREPSGAARIGTIEGTSLGGATKHGDNLPMLNIHVNWDDGTESTTDHTSLEVI